jgi:hypothetical protein
MLVGEVQIEPVFEASHDAMTDVVEGELASGGRLVNAFGGR